MKKIAMLGLTAFWGACASYGADTSFKQVLAATPSAELPAKAAVMVQEAKPRQRETVTLDVVKAAVEINPASATAIVGAIARTSPESAATAASVAAAEQPKQAAQIARAAAAAAPAKVARIVVAMCRAVPNEYRNIAVMAAQTVPGSNKEILNAVETALPELKPAIERSLAGYNGGNPSVATVLDVKNSSETATTPSTPTTAPASVARNPLIGGPPFIPFSKTPTNIPPAQSGNFPPGGHDYAKP
jgi:hypothetical protein